MSKRLPKLVLRRESLRILSAKDLARIQGGADLDTGDDTTVHFPDTLSPAGSAWQTCADCGAHETVDCP